MSRTDSRVGPISNETHENTGNNPGREISLSPASSSAAVERLCFTPIAADSTETQTIITVMIFLDIFQSYRIIKYNPKKQAGLQRKLPIMGVREKQVSNAAAAVILDSVILDSKNPGIEPTNTFQFKFQFDCSNGMYSTTVFTLNMSIV